MDSNKVELHSGMTVKVIGHDQKVLEGDYEIDEVVDKNVLRVKDSNNIPMRIHRSRVVLSQVAKGEKGEKVAEQKAEAKGKESKRMDTAAASGATAPAVTEQKEEAKTEAAKPAKAPAKEKVVKVKKAPVPFDLAAWIKENGGDSPIHLAKKSPFDNDKFELQSHVLVNATAGRYCTINVYKYPDGTLSLGKNGAGGNIFPLKGHRLTIEQKKGKDGKQKVTRQGHLTADEYVKQCEKKGYKVAK